MALNTCNDEEKVQVTRYRKRKSTDRSESHMSCAEKVNEKPELTASPRNIDQGRVFEALFYELMGEDRETSLTGIAHCEPPMVLAWCW